MKWKEPGRKTFSKVESRACSNLYRKIHAHASPYIVKFMAAGEARKAVF